MSPIWSISGAGSSVRRSRARTGDQFLGLERLHDVVISAGFKAQDHVYGVGLRRQHDDRHTGLGADLTAHVNSVGARQHQVQ